MISFGITTHNEVEYLPKLMDQLLPTVQEAGDEIVIVDDYSDDPQMIKLLDKYARQNNVSIYKHNLNNDFAKQKNYLNTKCVGNYIFQIDADELLGDSLLLYIGDIVEYNDTVDLFLIPRVNIVNGLTQDDIHRWGWKTNDDGYVMFPDYQTRLYKNREDIRWEGKVHERIVGHKTHAPLPEEKEWSIIHIKDIERQRKQNEFYERI